MALPRPRSAYEILQEERSLRLQAQERAEFNKRFEESEQEYMNQFASSNVDVGFEGATDEILEGLDIVAAYRRNRRECKKLFEFQKARGSEGCTLDEMMAVGKLIAAFHLEGFPTETVNYLLAQPAIQIRSERHMDAVVSLIFAGFQGEVLVSCIQAQVKFLENLEYEVYENVRILPALDGTDNEIEWVDG